MRGRLISFQAGGVCYPVFFEFVGTCSGTHVWFVFLKKVTEKSILKDSFDSLRIPLISLRTPFLTIPDLGPGAHPRSILSKAE